MNNEIKSTTTPKSSPTSDKALDLSAACSAPSRPTLSRILEVYIPELTNKVFRQDGIITPTEAIALAVWTDRLLQFSNEQTEDILTYRQRLDDIEHTRPPWL